MYSWIQTHKEIAEYLLKNKENQPKLIQILKDAGIVNCFKDYNPKGTEIELDEVDPFTFMSCMYKHGEQRKLEILQKISGILHLTLPTDVAGLPSANAQMTWLFTFKYKRVHNEIERLWNFFSSVLDDTVTDENFADILSIIQVGKATLTEGLYRIRPDKYFPVDRRTISYLEQEFQISPDFKTFTEYQNILKKIREKTEKPFYEIVYESTQRIIQNPKKYWLYAPGEKASKWDEFYEKGIMAIGWDYLGDLNIYTSKKAIEIKLQELEGTTKSKQNDATANYEFQNGISLGDIIIVKRGQGELLGYGEVTSDSHYDTARENYKNYRTVEWIKKGVWKTDHKLVIKTLTDITSYPTDNPQHQFYYERLLELMNDISTLTNTTMNYPINSIFYGPPGTGKTYTTLIRAAEIMEQRTVKDYGEAQQIFNQYLGDRIEFITFHQNYSYEDFIQGLRPDVENEGNLSFERKDGVFKRIADRALRNLELSGKTSEEVSEEQRFDRALQLFIDELEKNNGLCQLNKSVSIISLDDGAFRYIFHEGHQSLNGLRMKFSDLREMYLNKVETRQDVKKLKSVSGLAKQHTGYYLIVYNKILKLLPKKEAAISSVKKENYVIIIDEINRANISRVFGELITLIEKDKRSQGNIPLRCTLPSGESFIVPSNLYIIGTMNTADKSIALLDIALRRRFEFEAMYPQYEIEGQEIYDLEIFKKINTRIKELKGHDFQIGHAYFMGENSDLVERMNKKVIPLLLEYFMNDEKEVRGILSSAGLKVIDNSWPLKITR